jgi:hypothetical protein
MPYALNINKGTNIMNESIGLLEAGIAMPIPHDVVNIAKSLRGVVVFEEVLGVDHDENFKKVYGKDVLFKEEEQNQSEDLTYQDFVKKYKDINVASKKWKEHKGELNES